MPTTTHLRGVLLGLAALAAGSSASGQSINLDLDLNGFPEAGGGVPSSTFGGAADSPGYWDRMGVAAGHSNALHDIAGNLTNVYVTVTGFGSGGGYPGRLNTGDFKALLDDVADIPGEITYTFHNLKPGGYLVYSYCVNPMGEIVPVQVSVADAIDPTETVTGPIPGNRFEFLITHSMHRLPSLSGDLVVNLKGAWQHAYVNGFQLVGCPSRVANPAAFTFYLAVS